MSAWMVVKDGAQQSGQYTEAQVTDLMAQNPGSSFMVWKAGMGQWADPKTLPEFQAALSPQSAPPAAAPAPAPQPAAAPMASDRIRQGGKEMLGGAAEQIKKYKDAKDPEGFLIHLKLVDKLIGWARGMLNEARLDGIDAMATKAGHLALPIAAIIFVIFEFIYGARTSNMGAAFMSLLILPVAVIVHYVAAKFLSAGSELIKKSPSRLSSTAFLDCYGLLVLIGSVGALFGAVTMLITAFGFQGFIMFVVGIGIACILAYVSGASLNPAALNLTISEEASAGQEAIGVFSFLMKMILRLVPVIFGVMTAVGALTAFGFLIWLVFSNENELYMVQSMYSMVKNLVFGAALVPFASYLLFLIYYLSLDVLRSILVVPGKLDKLIGQGDSE